jgi:hypothetical protein
MIHYLTCLLLCIVIFVSHSGRAQTDAYEKFGLPDFIIGACTHFIQGKGSVSQNLDLLQEGGIMALRDECTWGRVEQEKDKLVIPAIYDEYINAARERGIMPLIILNYANRFYDGGSYPRSDEAVEGFARYCEAMVQHGKGRVQLYQIWNEWDGGCGMNREKFGRGDVDSYMKLLRTVYPRIKAIDPDAAVISNSVCTGDAFFEETLKQGLVDCCDILSLHTYVYGRKDRRPEEAWLTRMHHIRDMIKQYNQGQEKALLITEMGWPTHIGPRGSSYDESAQNLARMYLLAKTIPYIKGIWWYDFQDDGWLYSYNENNFGLVRPDLSPKASFNALRDLSALIKDGQFIERVDVGRDDLWVLRFKLGQEDVFAAWTTSSEEEVQLILRSDAAAPSPLSVRRVGDQARRGNWGHRPWATAERRVLRDARSDPQLYSCTLNQMPSIISGDLSQVRIDSCLPRPYPESARPLRSVLHIPHHSAIAAPLGQPSKPVHFAQINNYDRLGEQAYGGHEDLDCSFTANYDRDHLLLTITVKDNVFLLSDNAEEAWNEDGVQIGLQVLDDSQAQQKLRTELDLALTLRGPEVFLRASQAGREPGVIQEVRCEISEQAGIRVYSVSIPAQLLGTKAFEPGGIIAAAILVNDNDGDGRKGFMCWGKGIGRGKDPSQYNLIVLH